MIGWIVFGITFVSHVGLIYVYDRQRKQLDSVRDALAKHRRTIAHLESQVRMASKRMFK